MLTLETSESNIPFQVQKRLVCVRKLDEVKATLFYINSDIKIYGALNRKVMETSGKRILGVKNIVEIIKNGLNFRTCRCCKFFSYVQ